MSVGKNERHRPISSDTSVAPEFISEAFSGDLHQWDESDWNDRRRRSLESPAATMPSPTRVSEAGPAGPAVWMPTLRRHFRGLRGQEPSASAGNQTCHASAHLSGWRSSALYPS